MLATFINALMSAEADAVCGAPYGMPDPGRVNVRNGYRHLRCVNDLGQFLGLIMQRLRLLRSGSW
jgi:transposase-like protein